MKNKLPAFFDKFIFALIVLNLISMVIGSEPDLTVDNKTYLFYFEVFSISIFSVEYLIRSWLYFKQKKMELFILGHQVK